MSKSIHIGDMHEELKSMFNVVKSFNKNLHLSDKKGNEDFVKTFKTLENNLLFSANGAGVLTRRYAEEGEIEITLDENDESDKTDEMLVAFDQVKKILEKRLSHIHIMDKLNEPNKSEDADAARSSIRKMQDTYMAVIGAIESTVNTLDEENKKLEKRVIEKMKRGECASCDKVCA